MEIRGIQTLPHSRGQNRSNSIRLLDIRQGVKATESPAMTGCVKQASSLDWDRLNARDFVIINKRAKHTWEHKQEREDEIDEI